MPSSFDIVSEGNQVEVGNAIAQTKLKEGIDALRLPKGRDARVESSPTRC
jgi:uncharacterized protein YajQ (UPF0234 family)